MGTWSVRGRSFVSLIGPWPLRPGAATAFVAVFMMVWVGSGIVSAGLPISPENELRLLLAIPSALVIGVVLLLLKRAGGSRLESLGPYLGALALAALAGAVFRALTGQLPAEAFPTIGAAVAFSAIRLFAFLLVVHAILGRVTARLEAQVRLANEALQESRLMQQRLIEADERMRAQVATLLHDRVQAGLIAACLELTDAVHERRPDHLTVSISEVVRRLEAMRDIDVRAAARTLSPDLENLDLRTALEDLAGQYLPSMQTQVEVSNDPAVLLDRSHLPVVLGAYRMAEQSLLNAAVHGHARHCRISVDIDGDALLLRVIDDGSGISGVTSPGLGTFVCDTWAALLGGSWHLSANPGGGVRVSARIPLGGPGHADVAAALRGTAR